MDISTLFSIDESIRCRDQQHVSNLLLLSKVSHRDPDSYVELSSGQAWRHSTDPPRPINGEALTLVKILDGRTYPRLHKRSSSRLNSTPVFITVFIHTVLIVWLVHTIKPW